MHLRLHFNRIIGMTLILTCLSFAKITVNVNSGNPALPFPQFRSYDNATGSFKNLAQINPVGVPHAEMEKRIREAYQIMMNRAQKTGASLGGIDYLYFSSTPNVTEGDGYALLAAAAMADKQTFDGLWLWIHDNAMNKVKRYNDCQEASSDYAYSHLVGWENKAGTNSAADADFDIGLALLYAYYQWGEFMGISDVCGEPISYKKETIEFIKALTDTLSYTASKNSTLISGDIGLDGYFKGGDSWQELTEWASDTSRSGFAKIPESLGPQTQWFDYAAPSYFHAFADFLSKEDSSKYSWNIQQFHRAEASADWLMGQILKNNKMIPLIGNVTLTKDTTVEFKNANQGEDFRCPMRTLLNSLWYGNPSYTWNPVTHRITKSVNNQFEYDIGVRFGKFLWDSRQAPWNNAGVTLTHVPGLSFWGPDVTCFGYTLDGKPDEFFNINWIPGTGAPSAVISQKFNPNG